MYAGEQDRKRVEFHWGAHGKEAAVKDDGSPANLWRSSTQAAKRHQFSKEKANKISGCLK
jgi:hypothetical protein